MWLRRSASDVGSAARITRRSHKPRAKRGSHRRSLRAAHSPPGSPGSKVSAASPTTSGNDARSRRPPARRAPSPRAAVGRSPRRATEREDGRTRVERAQLVVGDGAGPEHALGDHGMARQHVVDVAGDFHARQNQAQLRVALSDLRERIDERGQVLVRLGRAHGQHVRCAVETGQRCWQFAHLACREVVGCLEHHACLARGPRERALDVCRR